MHYATILPGMFAQTLNPDNGESPMGKTVDEGLTLFAEMILFTLQLVVRSFQNAGSLQTPSTATFPGVRPLTGLLYSLLIHCQHNFPILFT